MPMRSLLAKEMSNESNKRRSPSIIARLMGLDGLPPQTSSQKRHTSVETQQPRTTTTTKSRVSEKAHRGSKSDGQRSFRTGSKEELEFKDVFEVLDAEKKKKKKKEEGNANLTGVEMEFIRQTFMEAKNLSTDAKLHHSREFNNALEALDSNKDLLLKFLQHPDSLFAKHLHDLRNTASGTSYYCPNGVSSMSCKGKTQLDSQRDSQRWNGAGPSGKEATKIVVLKPKFGEIRTSDRIHSDELRADRRLPCIGNRESFGKKTRSSRIGESMCFESSVGRGYAGDESSSGSDSGSDIELVAVPVRRRTSFRGGARHRSRSSMSKEAKRRLSERWKIAHQYEQEREICRSSTLAEMLANSDRKSRPSDRISGFICKEEVVVEEEEGPIGISSSEGWKGASRRNPSKPRSIMRNEIHPINRDESVSLSGNSSGIHYVDEDHCPDSDIDTKIALSSLPSNLLTNPDGSGRSKKETTSKSSGPELSKEGEQPSPVSVLEASYRDDESSSSCSECFESLSTDIQGLKKELQLLKMETGTYNEGPMAVSSDEEEDEDESLGQEWRSLYLADVLANSKLSGSDLDAFMAASDPFLTPYLFEELEKKYSNVKSSARLERMVVFDRIKEEVVEIVRSLMASSRVCGKWEMEKIGERVGEKMKKREGEEGYLVEKESEWLRLQDEIEDISREMEIMIIEELVAEIVTSI